MDKKTLLTIELIDSLPSEMPTEEKASVIDRIFKIPKYGKIRIAIKEYVRKHGLPKDVCNQALEVVVCHESGMSREEVDQKYPHSIDNNHNVFELCKMVLANEI